MNDVETKPVTNASNASEEQKTPPKEKKVIGKHPKFFLPLLLTQQSSCLFLECILI